MPPTKSRKRKLVASSTSNHFSCTTKAQLSFESNGIADEDQEESLSSCNKKESIQGVGHQQFNEEDRLLLDDNNRVSVDDLPVYVDVASQTAYYLSVRVTPPYSEYVQLLAEDSVESSSDENESLPSRLRGKNKDATTWPVRVGDTVIVHTDSAPLPNSSGGDKQIALHSNIANSKYAWFPFTVSWSPGEVVSIYRKFSRPEAIALRRKITGDEAADPAAISKNEDDGEEQATAEYIPVGGGEIMMEVRWLYRTSEVPIVTTLAASTTNITTSMDAKEQQLLDACYEEVFETDHVDQCSTLCLLAPLELKSPYYEQPSKQQEQHVQCLDQVPPKVIFSCHRFWSVRRRCLVPVGTLLSRAARGRLHSREIQRNHALKLALENALALDNQDSGTTLSTEDYVLQQQQQQLSFSPTNDNNSSNKQILVDAASTFALASAALDAHSLGIPLRGRENEQRRIANFLRLAIRSGNNGRSNCTMFIAGPPGTGKTSSVKCVIAQLVEEQSKGLLPEFHFVYINCMELRDPFDAYVSLWEGISGEKRTAGAAAELLERHFVKEPSQYAEQGNLRQKKRPATVVVLLDEIDYLTTNKQTVLYNFFNWPLKSEGLVILGISNTINLPERLHPRVQSRLGAERCIFQSYKVQEVVDILSFRLSRGKNGPCDVAFDRDAITFAARKTAVFTGDIRKAFQLCRVAAECVITDIQSGRRIAAEEGRGGAIVRIPDVQKAAKDLLDSPLLKAVATCTSFEALVLVSLAALRWSSGREDGRCRVKDLLIKMRGVANSLGNVQYFPVPTFDELIEMLNRMGEARYLTLTTTKATRVWSLVQLNMANDELKMALHNSPHQELAQKNLKSFLI